jgi:D-alanyl-D-alanine carboxypeptidase
MGHLRLFAAFFLFVFLFSCVKKNDVESQITPKIEDPPVIQNHPLYDRLSNALSAAQIPANISERILSNFNNDPAIIEKLSVIMQNDPYTYILVDKQHALSSDYEPFDLVTLTNKSYRVNRNGMLLRQAAENSLEEMAAAARTEGLTLLASSTYRSYAYQVEVYNRNVREMGQEEADRVSARAGHSQHQLGLVVDFGSITDAFADTREGRWLAANASRFGWSLSFPQGYEEITGYVWESWHYRYVGPELASFIDTYFDGIQQYALRFIHEYNNN